MLYYGDYGPTFNIPYRSIAFFNRNPPPLNRDPLLGGFEWSLYYGDGVLIEDRDWPVTVLMRYLLLQSN